MIYYILKIARTSLNIFLQLKAFMLFNSKFKKILVSCGSLFIGVSNLLHKKLGKKIFCKVLIFLPFAKHFSQNSDSFCYFSQLLNTVNIKIDSFTYNVHRIFSWSPFHKCWEPVIINHTYILFNPFLLHVETFQWSIYWNFNNVLANKKSAKIVRIYL